MVDSDDTKLFVGGISRETTENTLRDHFGKYGTVVGSVVARDRHTGSPRGFGFVSFSDSSSIDKALLDTHVILERTVEVKKAIPKTEQPQNQQQSKGMNRNSRSNGRSTDQFRTKKIFVGGLAHSVTEEEFKSYFEKFGRITDVVVMHDNVTNRPRGFGFITFDSEDAVEDVIQKTFHELSGKFVEVKKAVPKEGNNNGSSRYVVRAGNGRDNFNMYQCGNYLPYSLRCEVVPGYGPLSGYGGATGYPYGANFYCGDFPAGGYSGISYGVTPLAPRSPWNNPTLIGVRGSPMSYGNAATIYPSYLNGVGLMGMTVNGYDGNVGVAVNGKPSQLSSSDAPKVADVKQIQVSGGM